MLVVKVATPANMTSEARLLERINTCLARKQPGMAANLVVSEDVDVSPDVAFARLCAVETWPVWFSIVKRAQMHATNLPLLVGQDVSLWSELNNGREEVYEVEDLISPSTLTFVGAFSCRRRIDFRIERRGEFSRIVICLTYPIYGGIFAKSLDRITLQRRILSALSHSLETLKGLVEHDQLDLRERAMA
jgi:hypothetical protein